jgi:hypothetical protein
MIASKEIVNEMEKRWKGFGNVSSEALRQSWRQQAEVFLEHIAAHDDPHRGGNFTVLSPPTGSAKTQLTVVFASLLAKLPRTEQPGMLVVTKLRDDCDLMADEINELSKQYNPELTSPRAVAYHGRTKDEHPLSELSNVDVLVITHSAYELALDILGSASTIEGTWPAFHNYQDRTRRLVVVDEAIELMEEHVVSAERVKMAFGFLKMAEDELKVFKPELDFLDGLQTELFDRLRDKTDAERKIAGKVSGRTLWKDSLEGKSVMEGVKLPNLRGLKDALKPIRFDLITQKADPLENQRLKDLIGKTLSSLEAVIKSWAYYAKIDKDADALLTARLLVPPNAGGAVILDATADSNLAFKLWKKADVRTPVPNTKHYRGVTLNVARVSTTGKREMKKQAKDLSAKLITDLDGRLPKGAKVFVVTHKTLLASLSNLQPENFELSVGSWGAINGSNQWRDHDTAVIFGLFHRPDRWSDLLFSTLQGPQSTEWLQNEGARRWKEYRDIKASIVTGQLVSDCVQAVNRIRVRRVIDETGGCPPANIYIMLPRGAKGDELLAGIEAQMPGITVAEWNYTGVKGRVRKSDGETAMIHAISCLEPGRTAAGTLMNTVGISKATFERYTARIVKGDLGDPLVQATADNGIIFQPAGAGGRGRTSYFYKPLAS